MVVGSRRNLEDRLESMIWTLMSHTRSSWTIKRSATFLPLTSTRLNSAMSRTRPPSPRRNSMQSTYPNKSLFPISTPQSHRVSIPLLIPMQTAACSVSRFDEHLQDERAKDHQSNVSPLY